MQPKLDCELSCFSLLCVVNLFAFNLIVFRMFIGAFNLISFQRQRVLYLNIIFDVLDAILTCQLKVRQL